MRRLFFPLRTSVELFADPTSPDAITRAKEAALLYDELIFEIGLLDVTVTTHGGSTFWIPPDQITPERLTRSRQPAPIGKPMTLSIGKQDVAGVSASEMRVMAHGEISHAYVAEFHSGILDELGPAEPDWVRLIESGGESQPGQAGDPVREAIRRLDFADLGDGELMPEAQTFLRSFVSKSFNRDAIVAGTLDASFSATPLFEPMVRHRGSEPDYAGNEALGVVVANVGNLPWEAVQVA